VIALVEAKAKLRPGYSVKLKSHVSFSTSDYLYVAVRFLPVRIGLMISARNGSVTHAESVVADLVQC